MSTTPLTDPRAAVGLTLEQKQAANVWDHVDDVLHVLELARAGMWNWCANSRCKYVELRIDMRDGGCIVKDRDGNRIDPTTLAHQHGEPQQWNLWPDEPRPLGDWQLQAAKAAAPNPICTAPAPASSHSSVTHAGDGPAETRMNTGS